MRCPNRLRNPVELGALSCDVEVGNRSSDADGIPHVLHVQTDLEGAIILGAILPASAVGAYERYDRDDAGHDVRHDEDVRVGEDVGVHLECERRHGRRDEQSGQRFVRLALIHGGQALGGRHQSLDGGARVRTPVGRTFLHAVAIELVDAPIERLERIARIPRELADRIERGVCNAVHANAQRVGADGKSHPLVARLRGVNMVHRPDFGFIEDRKGR